MDVPEKKRKLSTNIFLISLCGLVALVAWKIVYIIFTFGLIPFLPESSVLVPIVFFIAIALSTFSGIMCFRWLYGYFKRQ
jgi:hypothetical protein